MQRWGQIRDERWKGDSDKRNELSKHPLGNEDGARRDNDPPHVHGVHMTRRHPRLPSGDPQGIPKSNRGADAPAAENDPAALETLPRSRERATPNRDEGKRLMTGMTSSVAD